MPAEVDENDEMLDTDEDKTSAETEATKAVEEVKLP